MPSFVLALERIVDVPGLGPLKVDVAFGGAFYAFCRAAAAHERLTGSKFTP